MPAPAASFLPSPGTHSASPGPATPRSAGPGPATAPNGPLAPTMSDMPAGREGPGPAPGRLHALAALGEPPRRYEIAGEVLAGALDLLQCQAIPAGEAVAQAAGQAGRQIAAGGTDLAELLGRSGYEPRHGPGGCIHLTNCPFHELVARHAGLVCTMNLHLLRALLGELG